MFLAAGRSLAAFWKMDGVAPRRRRFLFARAVSGFAPRGQLSPLEVALIAIRAGLFLSRNILRMPEL